MWSCKVKKKNGLTIKNKTQDYSVSMEGMIVSGILAAGIMLCISDSFASLSDAGIILSVVPAVVSAGMAYLLGTKYGKTAVWIIPLVMAAVCLIFFGAVKNGMIILGNDFLSFLTTVDGKIHLLYEHTGSVAYVAVIIMMLVSYLSAVSVFRRSVVAVLPVLIATILSCYAGFTPMGAGLLIFFMGMIALASYIIGKNGGKKENLMGAAMKAAAIFICALMSLSCLILPDSMFEKSLAEKAAGTKHDEKYHVSTPSMPEGKLDDLGAFDKNATASLRLSMEYPQKMYLKGMIGEVYTGNSWESLEKSTLAEYSDGFYWMSKYGFFPQISVSLAEKLSDEETEEFIMQITTLASCRENVFVPYALSDDALIDKSLIGCGEIYAREDTGSYTYSYTPGSVPEWYMAQNVLSLMQEEEKVNEYLTHEEVYRDFVYDNYLQITNSAVGALDRIFGDEKKQRTLAEIRKSIFDTLEENLSYDETVVTRNSGNDFFRYFMEQTKSGYSVHYATAAVLMLRYYGVPARYVEGYFLSKDEAEEYEPSETIILTESHAHAWAEYYLDGVGWIPFEVTPGYVDDEELKVSGENISNQQIYDKNELKYTPPIQQEERQPLSNWRDLFRIRKEHVIALVLIIIAFFILRAAVLRNRLRKSLGLIEQMPNKEAVKSLYGYAALLSSKLDERPDDEEIRLINREAMFSDHEMTDEDRQKVNEYVGKVRECCRKSWKIGEKIKYRYFECIYL